MSPARVAIVASHPIQYHVPWFRALAARPEIDLKVYFAAIPDERQQGTGFGIAFRWDIPLLEGYKWQALRNTREPAQLGTFFGTSTPDIAAQFRAERPDAVIVTGWNTRPLLQALAACRRLDIACIVRGESNAMRERSWRVRLIHRALLARYNAFLAIGKSNREFYMRNGVAPASIFPCRYFVDNARFAADASRLAPERAALRRGWGIAETATCFLFAGKLQPKKRVLDLIDAIAIAAQRDRIHGLIVGTGEQMDVAREKAAGLPVTFAGFLNQSEIARAYVAADCLVLPSDTGETWGLVVNEAMACGVPAIVSDRVGCGPDLVEDGVTGATFPLGDVQALAGLLGRFAMDSGSRARMGANARERVASYSVEAAVDGTLQAVRYVSAA